MTRLIILSCAIVLAACGGGSGPSLPGVLGPQSAQGVAESSSDFPGLQKCPESGSYDSYLKQEQTKSPDQYQSDKTTWDDLKASGANDSYIAVWENKTFEVAEVAFNNAADAKAAVTKVNGRIR